MNNNNNNIMLVTTIANAIAVSYIIYIFKLHDIQYHNI